MMNDVDFRRLDGETYRMRIKKSKSAPVGVIGKVLGILELLDQFPDGLQLKDVAANQWRRSQLTRLNQ
jgi:hypothetical protein